VFGHIFFRELFNFGGKRLRLEKYLVIRGLGSRRVIIEKVKNVNGKYEEWWVSYLDDPEHKCIPLRKVARDEKKGNPTNSELYTYWSIARNFIINIILIKQWNATNHIL